MAEPGESAATADSAAPRGKAAAPPAEAVKVPAGGAQKKLRRSARTSEAAASRLASSRAAAAAPPPPAWAPKVRRAARCARRAAVLCARVWTGGGAVVLDGLACKGRRRHLRRAVRAQLSPAGGCVWGTPAVGMGGAPAAFGYLPGSAGGFAQGVSLGSMDALATQRCGSLVSAPARRVCALESAGGS